MGAQSQAIHLAREGHTMNFHQEILSNIQSAILPSVGAFASEHGFYLGGGTAVALYLGHRKSVDFDWFSQERMEDPLMLAGQAREHGLAIENPQIAPGTLHALIDGVRTSFFDYPYPEIGKSSHWPECSVDVASLDDLACMKLVAIAQRGSRKDFIDLYFIALEHKPIHEIIALYKRKYLVEDIVPVLMGLGYFDDADEEPSPVMIREASWDQIKCECENWSRSLAESL